jgi:hypothetical protein
VEQELVVVVKFNSIFSSITSAGGGNGGNALGPGNSGGSGSGVGRDSGPIGSGGAGNTPPVSPPQGNPGGGTALLLGLVVEVEVELLLLQDAMVVVELLDTGGGWWK